MNQLEGPTSAEGYEHSDIPTAAVLAGAAGLLLILVIVLVAITIFEASVTGIPPSLSRPKDLIEGLQTTAAPTPPPPRLEAVSGQSLGPYLAAEAQRLNSYGWVDRQAGIVFIPIDRAMDLIVRQGLPARMTPTTARDEGLLSPSSASSGRVEEAYP